MSKMLKQIPSKELVLEILHRFCLDGICGVIVNTILPIFISLYAAGYTNKQSILWFIPIILMMACIIGYSVFVAILQAREKEKLFYWNLLEEAYHNHSKINSASATKLYRLGKIIRKQLDQNNPVDRSVFDKMADFRTIAFDICNNIYNIITDKYGTDTKCEVTICHEQNNKISMIAYANQNSTPPLTYQRVYKKNNKYLFGKMFMDLNAQIHVCPNKEAVEKDFILLKGSETREKQVCQYIGIPLITSRQKIEILLQIDVSKPDVFGKTEENVLLYAEKIFRPYIMLLYKAYERDLIFNGYYDTIIEKLQK